MVVCHAGMTDKTDDETWLHIPSRFLSFFLAGTLPGPLASLGFILCDCLITQSMSKFISFISGSSFLHDGRLRMPSLLKTDWNCSSSTLAFAQSDVAGKPEIVLRVGMPVSSLCKAYIYDQWDFDYHSDMLQLFQISKCGDFGNILLHL